MRELVIFGSKTRNVNFVFRAGDVKGVAGLTSPPAREERLKLSGGEGAGRRRLSFRFWF
jgi:hypothetical protein